MSIKYNVIIEPFARSHYLKKISKKYKKSFLVPWSAFELMLQRFELMLKRNNTNVMVDVGNGVIICKTEFKILPNESTKTSGNRCIVAQDMVKKEIKILLVYHKSDVQGGSETKWWKMIVRDNYGEYKKYL